ncbi:hypothetical protein HNP55_002885 [Paucibacter oligotrophus]|nr:MULTISPECIES: hypothetical protein [Betaproteobacteria]MBB4844349.1 hypothetical protein [Roseateles oligotrophus]
MSLLRYTVLKLFESPRGHLAEISRMVRPDRGTWVDEWVWIEERHVMTLQSLPERGGLDFEEGELHLAGYAGELRWSNGRIDTLSRVHVGKLPQPSRSFLELHLS